MSANGPPTMTPTGAVRIALLCLAVSGCAGLGAGTVSGPHASADPPDDKKVVELVNAAFKTAKLSGAPEASPVRPTTAPQPGDWMFCIKSIGAQDQSTYAVFVLNGAVLDVRSNVLLDRCSAETYHAVKVTDQPAVTTDHQGEPAAKAGRRRHG